MKKKNKKKKLTAEQKFVERIYGGYRQEATLYCVILIPCFLLYLAILIIFFWIPLLLLLCIALYTMWHSVFRYAFWSLIEPKRKLCLTEKLIFLTPRLDEGYKRAKSIDTIPSFYDKKMDVHRYKFICKNEKGQKVVLRSIMSRKKYFLLIDEWRKDKNLPLTVTYGKYSHVIWAFGNKQGVWADQFNHSF